MGGPRASTMRRIYAGEICCHCSRLLPERVDGRSGERTCQACVEARLVTVGMNFMRYAEEWAVSFLEADMRTVLAWKGSFRTTDPLYRIVRSSYQPAAAEREFENSLRYWGRGTVTLRLSADQHLKLTRPNPRAKRYT